MTLFDMDERDELAERVKADPEGIAYERETSITIAGDEDVMRVFSAKPTIVKSILRHDEFSIKCVSGETSDGQRIDVRADSGEGMVNPLSDVFSVVAESSHALLTVKGTPRKNARHSGIVNTPASADRLEEAFGDD